MILGLKWRAVIRQITRWVLQVPVCKEILRRSGWKPGLTDPPSPFSWMPGNAFTGDQLWQTWIERPPHFSLYYGHLERTFTWQTPAQGLRQRILDAIDADDDYYMGKAIYYAPYNQIGTVGPIEEELIRNPIATPAPAPEGNIPIPLLTLALRNPDYHRGETNYGNVNAGLGAKELLVWESVPEGLWYFPFNVPWFVTKRDLSYPSGAFLPRQITLRTNVVGDPPASILLRYSVGTEPGDGGWTTLAEIDLAFGGAITSGWQTFPEGAAAADVWLAFFIDVRSDISRLHLGSVQSLMRWAPREPSYYENVY